MTDWHPHPSDYRWTLDSGAGYRPTISVINPPEEEERHRRRWESVMLDELQIPRVPFGFARTLLEDDHGRPLCGFPHGRNPRMFGGCIDRHGHTGGHRYGVGDRKVAIRPTKHSLSGHPYQQAGQETPPPEAPIHEPPGHKLPPPPSTEPYLPPDPEEPGA